MKKIIQAIMPYKIKNKRSGHMRLGVHTHAHTHTHARAHKVISKNRTARAPGLKTWLLPCIYTIMLNN